MIDSHAHVAAGQFDEDRDVVIARAKRDGVSWIEVGTTLADSRVVVTYPHASVGVHPHELSDLDEHAWDEITSLVDSSTVCAIGEVGLDFSRGKELEIQEEFLRRFISLAQQKNLPMIFHVRNASTGKTLGVNDKTPSVEEVDAHTELIRILASYSDADRPSGVIHTFSGTLAQAQKYISLGMMISFSGVITFQNAGELPEVATRIPLDRILVETDCPFLTPDPHRGKRNEPLYVRYVIEKIAALRGISFEEVDTVTTNNTKQLFALD